MWAKTSSRLYSFKRATAAWKAIYDSAIRLLCTFFSRYLPKACFFLRVCSYLWGMESISINQIWGTAWQRFKVHWGVGVGISFLAILLSVVIFVLLKLSHLMALIKGSGELIATFIVVFVHIFHSVVLGAIFFSPVLPSYGLGAWNSSAPLPLRHYFPSLGAGVSVFFEALLIALPGMMGLYVIFGIMLIGMTDSGETTHIREGLDKQMYIVLIAMTFILTFILLVGTWLLFFTYPFWAIDKAYGIFRGLRAAARFTVSHWEEVFPFWLRTIGINFLGALAFGVGLLVTVPWTMIAMGGLYKSLIEKEDLFRDIAKKVLTMIKEKAADNDSSEGRPPESSAAETSSGSVQVL